MKMKVTEKPVYPEIEVFAKTHDSCTGTIDRKTFGRALLTLEAVSKDYQVVGGDGVGIRTVTECKVKELKVRFVGDITSLASFKFFDCWVAANPENDGVMDIFTTDSEKIDSIRGCAERMSGAHPECDGQWEIIDAETKKRVFVRLVDKDLSETGIRLG